MIQAKDKQHAIALGKLNFKKYCDNLKKHNNNIFDFDNLQII